MIAPGHPSRSRDLRLPTGAFDVVTLPGARGAALWRWWLADAEPMRVALGLHAPSPYAPPPTPPPRDADAGVTVIRLDLADARAAGIVIHL